MVLTSSHSEPNTSGSPFNQTCSWKCWPYLYTDECRITPNNVMELFALADLWDIERLKFMRE